MCLDGCKIWLVIYNISHGQQFGYNYEHMIGSHFKNILYSLRPPNLTETVINFTNSQTEKFKISKITVKIYKNILVLKLMNQNYKIPRTQKADHYLARCLNNTWNAYILYVVFCTRKMYIYPGKQLRHLFPLDSKR